MKILHVCKVYLPTVGGVQEVIRRISYGLSGSFEFSILTTGEVSGRQIINNVEVITKSKLFDFKSMPISISIFFSIWNNIKRYDRVCIHYPFPIADMAIGLYPFKTSNIIVYWHSEIVSQKILKIFVRPFTLLMLKKANKIVVSSPNLINHSPYLRKHKNKCHVIPFGLEDHVFDNKQISHKEKESNTLKLVSVGRHVEYKGFDVLINAIKGVDCTLTILGDGPLLKNHKELVNQLNLRNKVTFVNNATDSEITSMLKESDVFVLPSKLPSEAFALVQVEAMCYGKPIINTWLESGVPWVARHEIEALTVNPDDANDLKEAIQKLVIDKKLLLKLAKNARLRYLDQFTIDQFLDETRLLYLLST